MQKEIGGYFELEQLVSNEYYNDLIPLNTARNALVYLLKARSIKKLFIPYFLCDSVSEVCEREGCSFEYYNVSSNFQPVFNKALDTDEYVYIVNYYGQITNETIMEFKKMYSNIIVDNVQAFYQKPCEGIDTIYSCRKFFGVPDGAYLSTDCLLNEELEEDISANRMKHLLGRYELGSASDFYNDFKDNDEAFSNLALMKMSKLTHNLLGAVDYNRVKNKREENFKYLHMKLKDKNKLSITIPEGPYAYPFYVDNGIKIRKIMAQNGIYIPTLWPNVINSTDVIANDFAKNILPLPIDQRLSDVDYEEILNIFKDYI